MRDGWNEEIKAAVERKEDAWKDGFGAREEIIKDKYMEIYIEKRGGLKGV